MARLGEGELVEGEWRVGCPRGFGETAGVELRAREEGCTAAFAAGAGTWVGSSRSTRLRGVRGRNQHPAGPENCGHGAETAGAGRWDWRGGTSGFPLS